MRFTTRTELLEDMKACHQVFMEVTASVPRNRYKEAGVWGDEWTLHDLFAHLTEWEQMFLGWYREGKSGGQPDLPASGYKWNETPRLNRAIQAKHRNRSTKAVLAEFTTSYREILTLASNLSVTELFTPGHFAWTRKNALVTYLAANTGSHYRTAAKIVRRWLRSDRD